MKRVAALLPDARVIIMLRDPIGRAWSQVQLDVGGRPPSLDFAMDHVGSTDSLERGNYPAIVDRWLDHFPRERVFVGFHDEARTGPAELVRAVVEFLGVDPERMVSPLPGPINASGVTTIPTALAVDLARRYAAVLEEMSLRLGGPAEAWRNAAERLLEAPPQSADLPLPLADDLDPGSPADQRRPGRLVVHAEPVLRLLAGSHLVQPPTGNAVGGGNQTDCLRPAQPALDQQLHFLHCLVEVGEGRGCALDDQGHLSPWSHRPNATPPHRVFPAISPRGAWSAPERPPPGARRPAWSPDRPGRSRSGAGWRI